MILFIQSNKKYFRDLNTTYIKQYVLFSGVMLEVTGAYIVKITLAAYHQFSSIPLYNSKQTYFD